MVTVVQPCREVVQAEQNTIAMTPDAQQSLWNALNATPKLTKAQRDLGDTMRGEE